MKITNRERLPILVSYAYLRKMKDAAIEELLTCKDFRIMLDSGAYTAHHSGSPIDVDDYISFLKEWGGCVAHYVALDVVGKANETRKNLRAMWSAGLKPMPVFVTGEVPEFMEELYEHSDVVAVPVSKPVASSLSLRKKFLRVRMDWASGRKLHWFSFTVWDFITRCRPYSCDSTSWNAGAKYGHITVYLGRGKMTSQLGYKRYIKDSKMQRKINMAIERFGYDPEKLLDQAAWKSVPTRGIEDHIMYQSTLRSWMEYVLDARKHIKTWVFLSAAPSTMSRGELYWFRHWLKVRREMQNAG